MAGKKTTPKRKPAKPVKSNRKPAANVARKTPRGGGPVVNPEDVRTILFDLARVLAPADLRQLMNRERVLRERAECLGDERLALLREQTLLALDCIRDHLGERAPQIPYYTVCMLGAAVSYFSEALDIIPDFLPRIGKLDDALVMAVAYQMGEDGIRRYCDAKGIESSRYFPERT